MTKQEKIWAELRAISDANGGVIETDMVIAVARKKTSEMHDQFPWNDKIAAHQRRQEIARGLIRSYRVQVITERHTVTAPYYIRDPRKQGNEPGYIAATVLRTQEDAAREAVVAAFARAAAVLQGARAVAAILNLENEIDDILDRIRGVNAAQLKYPAGVA